MAGSPNMEEAGTAPYGDLYVYLLNGLVGEDDEVLLGDTFLGNWVEEDSSFLFFKKPADKPLTRLLKKRSDLELVDEYYFTYDQWQGGGLDVLFIEDFLIIPPWLDNLPAEGKIRILLDPGVVFGNGLHPTTRDCLKAVAFARRQRPFSKVLDLGTGTGVLSVAAAFLEAEKVLAADLNPLCVHTAIKNIEFNRLEGIIEVIAGPAEDFFEEPADLLLANIHHAVIRELLERRSFRTGDRLILSGLMRSQARDVKSQLGRLHLRILREWDHEMTWFTLLSVVE